MCFISILLSGTFIAWDNRILNQLADGLRARFPVILTRKYACDQSVITMLRARTFGNSPAALQHNIQELHSKMWLSKTLSYLTDVERLRKARFSLMGERETEFDIVPTMQQFPTAKWFLAAYVRDVYARIDDLMAQLTSVCGNILKIDSTKKICKKLQGRYTVSVMNVRMVEWKENMNTQIHYPIFLTLLLFIYRRSCRFRKLDNECR